MAWSESAMLRDSLADILDGTVTSFDLDAISALKFALYDNTPTPDKDEAGAAYNVGVFTNTNEQSDVGEWDAGGEIVANNDVTQPATGVVMLDGDDIVSGASATLTVHGGLLYIDTTAGDRAWSFHWFGGEVAVVDGELTVAIDALGFTRITV